MLRTIALASVALAALSLPAAASTKPCDGSSGASLEQLLPLARTALYLPGTESVAIDEANRCIGIQVRSRGTARLVKLLLRGVEVPRAAVRLEVLPPAAPPGA